MEILVLGGFIDGLCRREKGAVSDRNEPVKGTYGKRVEGGARAENVDRVTGTTGD